jgi:DNA-binding response OmpR family regulator
VNDALLDRIAELEELLGLRGDFAPALPHMSRTERRLLGVLNRHAGRIVPREFLQRAVWANDEVDARSVDVYVLRLRRRGFKINTAIGEGYWIPKDEK